MLVDHVGISEPKVDEHNNAVGVEMAVPAIFGGHSGAGVASIHHPGKGGRGGGPTLAVYGVLPRLCVLQSACSCKNAAIAPPLGGKNR